MTKRNITVEEAIKLTEGIENPFEMLNQVRGFRWIKEHNEDSYKTWKETYDLLPCFIVDERFICCIECGFGHDVVFDLHTKKAFQSSKGIFEEQWAFMSDYYGYGPDGAFFYKV